MTPAELLAVDHTGAIEFIGDEGSDPPLRYLWWTLDDGRTFAVPIGTEFSYTDVTGMPDDGGPMKMRFRLTRPTMLSLVSAIFGANPLELGTDNYMWISLDERIARCFRRVRSVDLSRFPHRCSGCGQAAYVGSLRVEHAVQTGCARK